MNFTQRLLVALFRGLSTAVFRVDAAQLSCVPARGPLILVTNHVNILEIPVIYAWLQPRPVHGMVLATRWRNPVVAWGLNACGAIPLARGGMNRTSFRKAFEILEHGEILAIAPEGTRSGNGRLQTAHPGVVYLALKSGAPMLPVAYIGHAGYKTNLKRLSRTDFHIATGPPFTLQTGSGPMTHTRRAQMLFEIMSQLAALLPPEQRSAYSTSADAPPQYLHFTQLY